MQILLPCRTPWPWLIALSLGLGAPARAAAAEDAPGGEVPAVLREALGPSQGAWPRPQGEVDWRPALRPALLEARLGDRPLFVTLRCLPCEQCAHFDQAVLDGGSELDPLLERYVTVRLTDGARLDASLLPYAGFQDLDNSWWGWLLSPEGRVYAVFGGRDHESDEGRLSTAALANVLRRVLDHHADPRRPGWDLDGPAPDLSAPPRLPTALPGYPRWKATAETADGQCLHCHQVAEVLRQPALDAGTFDTRRDLAIWPLPENIGVVLDVDHGLRVDAVQDDSPAAALGIAPGDELLAAGGRKLFGQADLRGVLHRRADPAGTLDLVWRRGDELRTGTLELAEGWRATSIAWRMSVSQGNIGAPPGFAWPHRGPRQVVPAGAMSISPWFGRGQDLGPAHAAGLRSHHVIVAVDGERPDRVGRDFMTWFRLGHQPGDEVVLTVLEDGREREIRYILPGA